MIRQLLLVLFLLIFTTTSTSWVLTSTETTAAKKLSINVTIDCTFDGKDNNAAKLIKVHRIRISKFRPNNKWETVTKIEEVHPNLPINRLLDADVSGVIDNNNIQNTHIRILFPVATSETFGQFLCEVDGTDIDDTSHAVNPRPIDIIERGITFDDILEIITQIKNDEQSDHTYDLFKIDLLHKAVHALEVKVSSNTKETSRISKEQQDLSDKFTKFSTEILNNQNKILKEIETMKSSQQPQQAWPAGTYSIPRPASGCPYSNTFDWPITSVKMSTESGIKNNDKVSNPSHLAGNTLQTSGSNHFVYMESCSKADDTSGPGWPKGKYCIQSYNIAGPSQCPSGFKPGSIDFDTNSDTDNVIQHLPHYYRNDDLVILYYCCREDGDVTQPILLPATEPFYLYRFGGVCQQVVGTDVSDEYISYHTNGVKDKYGNSNHPDGTLNGVTIDLCYYKPSG